MAHVSGRGFITGKRAWRRGGVGRRTYFAAAASGRAQVGGVWARSILLHRDAFVGRGVVGENVCANQPRGLHSLDGLTISRAQFF